MEQIVVVTGANQGIGLATVAGLADTLGAEDVVYLTGRDAGRVRAAASGLRVRAEVLDVSSDESVGRFAELLRDRHGGVDVVVSNAAARISPSVPSEQQVREFVDTNNLGTTRMIRWIGPLLRPGGRFLVVASALGSLRNLPEHLHARFDTASMTLDQVDATMTAYADAVESGRAADDGWPEWINIPSKVGQVAAMRVYARDVRERFIAAACPGLVDTDASRPWFDDMSAAQTPEEAATALVRLATGPVEPSFHGQLVQHGRVLPWI
jgi:NAD(P)-dependent dehydrogenase (short-subunit alcohol dehydrogenase family)